MKQKKSPRSVAEKSSTSPVAVIDGMVILDGSFRPVALDPGGCAILDDIRESCGPSEHNGSLPPTILSLLDAWPERDTQGTHSQITVGDHEYSCRVMVIKSYKGAVMQPMIALYFKREISAAEAVHQLSLDYHLTDREQETLIGVSMGLTSKELATRMNISPNTVKAFLRLIMIKMGTTTRAGVVGKLLDQNGRRYASG